MNFLKAGDNYIYTKTIKTRLITLLILKGRKKPYAENGGKG
jgi:hypothetical protein